MLPDCGGVWIAFVSCLSGVLGKYFWSKNEVGSFQNHTSITLNIQPFQHALICSVHSATEQPKNICLLLVYIIDWIFDLENIT